MAPGTSDATPLPIGALRMANMIDRLIKAVVRRTVLFAFDAIRSHPNGSAGPQITSL